MMTPRIQQLTRKKATDDAHRPGKKVLRPKNSSSYPWCSHAPCETSHRTNAVMPRRGLRRNVEVGRYRGRKIMYHRKYYAC